MHVQDARSWLLQSCCLDSEDPDRRICLELLVQYHVLVVPQRLAGRGIEHCGFVRFACTWRGAESLDAHTSGSTARLNRWIGSARKLWDRIGIVGDWTRGVTFLSELVVGVCLEE